jgi:hypothetical protein
MTSEDLVVRVFDALAALGMPFMVSGSLASNFYGVPRATQDADLVLDLARLPFEGLAEHLGAHFEIDGQVGFESITGSARLVLRARESPFEVELFGLTDSPHDLERFARRMLVDVLDRTVALPTAEDVVVTKLVWFQQARRRKDFEDARNVIAVQRPSLDWTYLQAWCRRLGLEEALRDAEVL